ncbi:SAM-dependent methyltransferase [Lachnospiraceae bacterium 45-P1]
MENQGEVRKLFETFLTENPVLAVLSGQLEKTELLKMRLHPVLLGETMMFQAEEFRGKQAFHKNMDRDQAADYLTGLMGTAFKQAQLETTNWTASVLVSKKGKATIKVKKLREDSERKLEDAWKSGLSHNRKKQYILEEGIPVPFLIDLGVQTREGRIVHARYDKFRQINRFLEFIEDILPRLNKERESVILDFGCGKSYLTFAMYYYLKELKGYPVRIIGLDLKEDVIEKCNALARNYGYEKLAFYTGDIASYEGVDQVDMVVTLHACDTATDYALEKAVRLGASVILSVPCCQHELNSQMESQLMKPVFQYGIIKERMAALYTDALRAQILEAMGYRVQILEFIDMEHTPKNLLIRAVKQGKKKENQKELLDIMEELHVEPTLYKLLMPDLFRSRIRQRQQR